jgi:hypothetical protein
MLPDEASPRSGRKRRLFLEIKALGYGGSYPVVRDYLSRNSPAREPLPPAPPTVRDVTNWLCRRPDTLTEKEKPRLEAILDRCPELQAASDQVRAFAAMITARHRVVRQGPRAGPRRRHQRPDHDLELRPRRGPRPPK